MTTEDDALLQRELHWQSRPGDRRRPPGSNAITAIGLVVTLVLWAITAVVLDRLLAGRPTGSGMIEPSAIIAIIVFGLEMLVAVVVAGRVWVAIGPGARSVLRPIAVLGPWPMLGIAFFAALYVVSFVAAPFLPRTPEPPTSGRNWRLMDSDQVSYEQAIELCKQAGARVPSRDDLTAFDPPYAGGTSAWVERPADENYLLSLTPDGKIARPAPQRGQVWREYVICFRP